MAKWTESAKTEWKAYSQRLRNQLDGSEADVAEVEEDLKRHVDEEIHVNGFTVIDAEQLRSILTRIGELEVPVETEDERRSSGGKVLGGIPPVETKPHWRFGLLVLISVIWPLISLIIETTTRLCTGVVFDPMPSVWHGLILFGIPIGNLLALSQLKSEPKNLSHWVFLIVAFNVGVSLVYTILFIPFLPIGVIAVFYLGCGLLPLTPLATCLSGFVLWSMCSSKIGSLVLKRKLFWSGFLFAIVALTALETPNLVTRLGLRWADAEDVSTSARGIQWLRGIGSEGIMLKACYERPRRVFDVSSWFFESRDSLTQDDARKIYYQVTGRAFNSVPPPSLYTRQGRWDMLDQEFTWEFDSALGGTSVAGRVRGLKMISSRMDGRIETSSATVYTEWTMEFENHSRRAREARAQIQLPAGGVVSRLTLWVNGEEREAAFASREQTRKAYQKIAVERGRDPVLVTTSGPDQVLVQCFPVPADGGKMKIRFGMTAPLDMVDLKNGRVRMPAMVERNFNLRDDLKHSVWLESRSKLEGDASMFSQGSLEGGDFTLQGKLLDTELLASQSTVMIERPEGVTEVWSDAQEEGHVVVQRLIENGLQPIQSAIVVIDGSVSMAPYFNEISESLNALESLDRVQVLVASDLSDFRDAEGNPIVLNATEASSLLTTSPLVGGQDNLSALSFAWDLALEHGVDTLWWIHGAQPTLLGDMAPVLQCMERSRGQIQLNSYAMAEGPNRIMEAFDGLHASMVPKYSDLKTTFQYWVDSHRPGSKVYDFERIHQKLDSSLGLENLTKVTRHIERLWAKDQVNVLRAKRQIKEATLLASTQQLVTPVSGAVVLETIEQYEEMGLVPVPVDTVPGISEPGTVVLLVLGVLAFLVRHWIIRRRRLNAC